MSTFPVCIYFNIQCQGVKLKAIRENIAYHKNENFFSIIQFRDKFTAKVIFYWLSVILKIRKILLEFKLTRIVHFWERTRRF